MNTMAEAGPVSSHTSSVDLPQTSEMISRQPETSETVSLPQDEERETTEFKNDPASRVCISSPKSSVSTNSAQRPGNDEHTDEDDTSETIKRDPDDRSKLQKIINHNHNLLSSLVFCLNSKISF